MTGIPGRRLMERFWEKVAPDAAADECWMWTASVGSTGYGQISVDGAPRKAHRVAYELLVADIPDGLHIDHLCRTPLCVNPWHLEPVTNAVNTARGRLREITPPNRLKTHCRNGHPYDEANTYIDPDTHRRCRECARRDGRASYHRAKDAA